MSDRPFPTDRAKHLLRERQFETLFIELLGWERPAAHFEIVVDGALHKVAGIAQKRGVQVLRCGPGADGALVPRARRQKIEREVTKRAYEHLMVFEDAAGREQVWQWVLRRPGEPARVREYSMGAGQAADELVQNLAKIRFALKDEETIDLALVVRSLRDAFDRDRVTRRFYDAFQQEHRAFLAFIDGITDTADREWYASLMLNRLMFVWFIQEKGFLDGDRFYLRNRLAIVREQRGPGQFHSFYRSFLRRLFHEGFGQQPAERLADLEVLIGDVPYLNGGLFEPHELEVKYPGIDVPDEAFDRLFTFFGEWRWHLDDRSSADNGAGQPAGARGEIDPDVLGYIFEKYINQKQMGAYYTKEDITGYICKSTMIPQLFDAAQRECAIAFRPEAAVWRLLRDDPDRYIYEPVRRGVIRPDGTEVPESELPDFVQVGMHDPKARMFDRRYNLVEAAWQDVDADGNAIPMTLPTETWREYVVRRERCLEVRRKLADGEVTDINDLVTLNLDLRQFAQDAIERCEGSDQLAAFWKAASSMTVLDPTCGSGAFLFAALNVLEPIYEACLDRMQEFVDELHLAAERPHPMKYKPFREALAELAKHPNRYYFIHKSIVVNNLFGVDIMEEAVEICKLRLFLKLVAQVDRVRDLEPLPDIDFNIRAGNTLVGFVTIEDVRRAAETVLTDMPGTTQARLYDPGTDAAVKRIEEDAEVVDRAFRVFQDMQTEHGMDADNFRSAKLVVRERLKALAGTLDEYLAREYGIDAASGERYEAWRRSHEPFHWFAEFYGIMKRGGFNVIVGNPPYVVYAPARLGYTLAAHTYRTMNASNLYAFVLERSIVLADSRKEVGMIVQLTAMSSKRMRSLQDLLIAERAVRFAPFPRRPESIFDGVEMPVAIICVKASSRSQIYTSRIGRMYGPERKFATATLSLFAHGLRTGGYRVAKIGSSHEMRIIDRLAGNDGPLGGLASDRRTTHAVYYQEACRYWVKAHLGIPRFVRNGVAMEPPHGRFIYLRNAQDAAFVSCLMNSSLFYWYYSIFSDCEHINDGMLRSFLLPRRRAETDWIEAWSRLGDSIAQGSLKRQITTSQGHSIEYDEMRAAQSKVDIDGVDLLLSKHFGLSDDELDYIANYDIKYRIGLRELDADGVGPPIASASEEPSPS